MTFLWPDLLFALLVVPVLIGTYLWLLRRKKKAALRYASLAMVKDAMGVGQRFRRHVPPALFLLAITTMVLAMARPAAVVTLPSQHETIILAIDVSGSMRAADVQPNRLAAAQAAAKAFVGDLPRNTRVGIVEFAGSAAVVQSPTDNREDLTAAIDRFQLQRGTAIGSGLLVSLKMIFPDLEFDLRSWNPRPGRERERGRGASLDPPQERPEEGRPQARAAGLVQRRRHHPAHRWPDHDRPRSRRSRAHGGGPRCARVYRRHRHGRGRGDRRRRLVNARASRRRSAEDDREHHPRRLLLCRHRGRAQEDLRELNTKLVMEKKETEVTALFTAAGAALALLSVLLSMLWYNRVL
jgi:Ca-activated chloride channel family protein